MLDGIDPHDVVAPSDAEMTIGQEFQGSWMDMDLHTSIVGNRGRRCLLAADHENWAARLLGSVHRHRFAAGSQDEQLKLQGGQVGGLLGWRCRCSHWWGTVPSISILNCGKAAVILDIPAFATLVFLTLRLRSCVSP